jgi:molecular chaperone GrpE
MNQRTSIPIRVRTPARRELPPKGSRAEDIRAEPERFPLEGNPAQETPVPAEERPDETVGAGEDTQSELQEWRDRALRLQADMDNFRRRQRRLAQDEIQTERERLLSGFLPVLDDLERALASSVGDANGLRHGVELTHRVATQMLQKEGVERIEAGGHPFDPAWHEAVATVRRNGTQMDLDTVVQVMEPGYRMGDRLLRPAKVVVAV